MLIPREKYNSQSVDRASAIDWALTDAPSQPSLSQLYNNFESADQALHDDESMTGSLNPENADLIAIDQCGGDYPGSCYTQVCSAQLSAIYGNWLARIKAVYQDELNWETAFWHGTPTGSARTCRIPLTTRRSCSALKTSRRVIRNSSSTTAGGG